MNSPFKTYLTPVIVSITMGLVSSCSLYKDPSDTDAMVNEALPTNLLVPDSWEGVQPDTNKVSQNWYLEFEEPQLNQLITQALDTNNPGIVYRMARIQESLSQITLARSGRQVFMDYGANYAGNFGGNSIGNAGSVNLPISWEADLWGRLKSGMLAANENMLAEVFQYEYTKQTIAANVSRLYFQIGTYKRALEIGQEFKSINQRLIEVQEKRMEIGISDAKDVHLAKANVASIEGVIKGYENQLQIANRNLEVLLGDYPNNQLNIQWEPKAIPAVVNVENPLALVSRRPDLISLEKQVRGAFYLSQQAELAKYPSLVLSANPALGTGGFAMGLGGSLLGPIFNGKAIKSKVAIANAEQRQVLSLYGLAILDAFKEVETSLQAEQILQNRLEFAQQVANESKEAYLIAVEQYKVGQQDLYYTLLLQSQFLLAELSVVEITSQLYFQRIQLYLALGGTINQDIN